MAVPNEKCGVSRPKNIGQAWSNTEAKSAQTNTGKVFVGGVKLVPQILSGGGAMIRWFLAFIFWGVKAR